MHQAALESLESTTIECTTIGFIKKILYKNELFFTLWS